MDTSTRGSALETEIEYEPRPVKDILKEMKDYSSLLLDLAYSSALFSDEELIKEAFELESKIDKLELQLLIHASLATRSKRDAEKMVSIFRLATAVNKISDAAADIALMALKKIKIPIQVLASACGIEDQVLMIPVEKGSWISGKTIKEVFEQLDVVFDVLGVKRKRHWIVQPGKNFRIMDGDVLLIEGHRSAVNALLTKLGKTPKSPLEEKKLEEDKYKVLVDMLISFRKLSKFAVYLAYTAILTKSEDVAQEVVSIEEHADELLAFYEKEILRQPALSADEKAGALRIAFASEAITDAAATMVEPLLRGLEPHPVIESVVRESTERITVIEMDESDDGKALSELGYEKKGIIVLAVRRNGEWHIMPPYTTFKVRKGDVLIVKYPEESEEYVEELEKVEDREEIIEEIQEEEWEEEEE